jgi:hypothetical protein
MASNGVAGSADSRGLTAVAPRHKHFDGRSFVRVGEVCVSQRHRDRLVTEQLPDGIEVDAGHHQIACECVVSKIVEAKARHACRIQHARPRPSDVGQRLHL